MCPRTVSGVTLGVTCLLLRGVDSSGGDVSDLDDHPDLLGGERPDDRGGLLPLLDVGQGVSLLGDDRLDRPAVRGLLLELLADLEPQVGVLEGALGGEGVLSVLLRQLYDRGRRVPELPGDPADAQLLHHFLEVLRVRELVLLAQDGRQGGFVIGGEGGLEAERCEADHRELDTGHDTAGL